MMWGFVMVSLKSLNNLPPAIPDGDISCREQSFFEIHEHVTAFEDRDRAIVQRFRRSSKISLDGQVKLDV